MNNLNMSGKRITEARKNQGLSRQKLAELLSVDERILQSWETEESIPTEEYQNYLAETLGISVTGSREKNAQQKTQQKTALTLKFFPEMTEIAVFPLSDFESIGFEIDRMQEHLKKAQVYIPLPSDWVGPIGKHTPFMVYVDDNSMEEIGIPSGSEIIINPEGKILNGESALVTCLGLNHGCSVKWVNWLEDGSIKLRSLNGASPSFFFTEEDLRRGFCRIIGKVMKTVLSPAKRSDST